MNQNKSCVKPHKCGENNLKTEFFVQFYTVQPPFYRRNATVYFFKENFLWY
ncbi:Uncharacterized protein LB4E_2568 [Leptospira borgpetersenii str. 4E]|nr:Uncharacterized protein LB4E_2568 [Leptospira borgpetersenii str. 4E]